MAAPSMSGTEFAGRVFALEALVIALAAELLSSEGEDKVLRIFAGVKDLAQAIIDDLTPTIGATPAVVTEIERHASGYVESNIEAISRLRGRLMKTVERS
jgi:hypothetical protein